MKEIETTFLEGENPASKVFKFWNNFLSWDSLFTLNIIRLASARFVSIFLKVLLTNAGPYDAYKINLGMNIGNFSCGKYETNYSWMGQIKLTKYRL